MRKWINRGYITEGLILALISFFSVPKVSEGICMVFDATVSIIKDSLWNPNFIFLSMGSFLMIVGPKMHMVSLDFG